MVRNARLLVCFLVDRVCKIFAVYECVKDQIIFEVLMRSI